MNAEDEDDLCGAVEHPFRRDYCFREVVRNASGQLNKFLNEKKQMIDNTI
jgi:hypothetical protein